MKKQILVAIGIVALATLVALGIKSCAKAEEAPAGATITAKQGAVMKWDTQETKFLTTFETIRTKKIEKWGKWNALWAGWSVDAGFAYDSSSINTGAILLGREFGTLGDYLPLDFPLKKYISITIYPVGLYIDNIFDHPKTKGCSGGAIIKATIKFG
jgi:hypothetical protein